MLLAAAAFAVAAMTSAGPTRAQSDDELQALEQRFSELSIAGKYGEALPLAERYADAVSARHGATTMEHANALARLAGLLQAAGRAAEAEPLYRRALTIAESPGPDDPRVADLLGDLAVRVDLAGRRAEAVRLQRRALAMTEKTLGSAHPNVAGRLINVAVLLWDTGEAEALLRRAVAIQEKSFGLDHPNVSGPLNTLALLLRRDANRLSEAESLLRRAFAIDEKGSDHNSVTNSLANLIGLLQQTNRFTEAEPLIRRALAFYERHFGPDDRLVANWLNILGNVLRGGNHLAEAEDALRRSLAIHGKHREPRDGLAPPAFHLAPSVVHSLARLLRETNRDREAEELERSWGRE